jgi:hypothetical protein
LSHRAQSWRIDKRQHHEKRLPLFQAEIGSGGPITGVHSVRFRS